MTATGQTVRPGPPSRAWAAIALLALAVAGALAVDALAPPRAGGAPPRVPQPPAAAGTWYCPVTGTPEDTAIVSVAPVSATASEVTVVRYVGGVATPDPPVGVSPGDELTLEVAGEAATQPLTVRWQGGPVVATYRLEGETAAAAPCAPAPSPRWYVTGFDTTLGATATLHLQNPFAVDAVARVVFATPEGRVALLLTDNVVVPAGSAVRLNLADFQPEVADLGVGIEVLAGRIVAAGEVRFGGRDGGPSGRALLPAAPAPALTAYLGYARSEERASSWLSVHNPADREAAVEVRVSDPSDEGTLLLEEVSVPAGGVVRIDLDGASATPEYGVSLASVNDVPVVVTRLTALRTESGRTGVGGSLAALAPATHWAVVGGGGGSRAGRVSVFNPGAQATVVDVSAGAGTPPEWSGVRIPPNGRVVFELTDAAPDREAIPALVTASTPVVAELRSQSFGGGLQLWTLVGVPAADWSGPGDRPVVTRDPLLSGRPLPSPATGEAASAPAAGSS